MKKGFMQAACRALAGVLVCGAVLLAGCAGGKNTLYIYNWSYYTPDSVLQAFEKEYNCNIVYDTFASNEEMYAKLKTGGSGYDLVFPSGDYVSIMIKQGMLDKIDHSKLTNLGNIDPLVLQKATYDPDMEYSVPYYMGAAGIAVNTAKVPDWDTWNGTADKSEDWSIFGRNDLAGKMTMMDDYREVLGDALKYLGDSVNTPDPGQLEQARQLVLNTWKPNLVKFDAEAFGKGFADEDFWVCQGYAEVIYQELPADRRATTKFFIPKEGGPAYIDSMCILKGAKHLDLAYKFIDFIQRPEIYAQFVDYFGFPSTVNVPARKLKKGPSWYSEADVLRCELKADLGENLKNYYAAWQSIKVGT
jgi:spermidine/putrescine transport system substrate-binding protein